MSYGNLIVRQPRGVVARRADRAFDDIRRAFLAASFPNPTPLVPHLGMRSTEPSWNPRVEGVEGSSHPEESHLEVLTEPCVNLSTHTALTIRLHEV